MVGIKLSYCVAKRNLIKGEQKGFITWQRGCYSQLLVQPPSIALRLLPQLLLVPGARCVAPCSLKAAPCIAWLHAPLVVPLSRSPAPPAAPPAAPTSIPPSIPPHSPPLAIGHVPALGAQCHPWPPPAQPAAHQPVPWTCPEGFLSVLSFQSWAAFSLITSDYFS